MWRTFITLFLCLTLISTRTQWSEACPSLERSAEVPWIKVSSTLHLRGKEYEYYGDDQTATNLGPIYRRGRTARERELERRIRKKYPHLDDEATLRIIDLQGKLDEEVRRTEEEFRLQKRPKENSFLLFLSKLGPQKKGRKTRRRKINLHEPDPKPEKVFVRVHEPAETKPTADTNDPPSSPPIVYAPPVPKEKYPSPGKRPGKYAPLKLSSSSENDIYDYPNQRVYRTKKKRTKYHDDWNDDPVPKIHVYLKGSLPPELANVSANRPKRDDSKEDEVRQVHLIPPHKSKHRRTVAKNDFDLLSGLPPKNRQSSGPVPVVF